MKSAFPFKDPQTNHLHRSVVATIRRLDYHFQLPCLNDESWTVICNDTLERERLEFVGDALIGAFVAEELYRRRPDSGPGYYTVARIVLTANSTFAHLMHKAGLVNDLSYTVKSAGDAFETILAAFHSEKGAEAFQTYSRRCFSPLIETVGVAYDAFRVFKIRQRKHVRMALKQMPPIWSEQRKNGPGTRKKKGNRFRTTTFSGCSGTLKRTEPQPSSRNVCTPKRTEPWQPSSTSMRAPVAVIDLTEESDGEEPLPNGEIRESRSSLYPKKRVLFKASDKVLDKADLSQYRDQASVSNNSTAINSGNEIQGLLRSISRASTVVSTRNDSEDELEMHSSPPHTSGEDAVQDDLVSRFKKASLGTIHNPITID